MVKTYIITIATDNKYYLPYLKKTCKKYGSELIILGYGEKWQGFNWRNKLVLNFLNKLNNDDIVCVIDGYDVICTRNLEQFADSFIKIKNKYNCKIIVGEHKHVKNNSYYLKTFMHSLYFGSCTNKFICAGTYCGYVKDLINYIKNIQYIDDSNKADDQKLLTKYCKLNPDYIYIDTNGELFLSLENKYKNIDEQFIYKNNNIYYNKYQPFFIHGPGETYLDNILIKMNIGYDNNNKICDAILKDYINKQIFRMKNSNNLFYLILFLFIIFIILFIVNRNKKIKKIK